MSISLLFSFTTLLVGWEGSFFETQAAQVKPSNVNLTNLNDAEVNAYYASVSGKKGDELLASLYDIIKNHREYSFDSNSDRLVYKIIDRNWSKNIAEDANINFSNYPYTTDNPYIHKLYADYNDAPNADRFFNEGATRVSFDKEHIWPQAKGGFGRTNGAGSDFHALWPSDIIGNQNMHSDYSFAVPTTSITNYSGDKSTYVGRNGFKSGFSPSNKVAEPLDQYKGDIARALFYMPARYYEYIDITHPKLKLVNGSPNNVTATSMQPGLYGDLATLLEWNALDPVDEYEIRRNNLIYNNYQLNRNPFIDHPEWADIAYNTNYSGSGATVSSGTSSVGLNPAWQTASSSLSYITLSTASVQTFFAKNATFNTSGLLVTAHYEDGTSRLVNDFSSNPANGFILSQSGSQTISISVTEATITKSETYTIMVSTEEKTLVSISLDTTLVQKTFTITHPFNSDHLIIHALYSDSTTQSIPKNEAAISTPNMNQIGEQIVSITLEGKIVNYSIYITNQDIEGTLNLPSDLIISEYIEGTPGIRKAIEIFNGTGSPIVLNGVYTIKLRSNDNFSWGAAIQLNGTIQNGDVFVLFNDDSADNAKLGSFGDQESTALNHNGDDAIGLFKNDVLIDIFGVFGEDPGTGWSLTATGNGQDTVDKIVIRKSAIKSAKTTWDRNEWYVHATYVDNSVTTLGSHIMNLPPENLAQIQAESYGQYFLTMTAYFCEELEGYNIDWNNLSLEYNSMVASSKTYFVNETSNSNINNAKERYLFLLYKYGNIFTDNFILDSSGNPLLQNRIINVGVSSTIVEVNLNIIGFAVIILFMVSFIIIKKSLIKI